MSSFERYGAFKADRFLERVGVQERKQEVTNVLSLVKNDRNST